MDNYTIAALKVLEQAQQWVAFNKEKVPFSPTAPNGAQADEPATWVTYQEAVAYWQANTRWLIGVGREFIQEDGITGVDLDKCIDEQGTISDYAQSVVALFNSYTEVSPSGGGLHIWVYGNIPDNIPSDPLKLSKIEMYDHDRYFTVTGNHWPGTPTTIENRQRELLKLHKEVRLEREKNKRAKQAAKATPATPLPPTPNVNNAYAAKALSEEVANVAQAGEGGRNTQLNTSAYSLGQLVAGGVLDRSEVERALYLAASLAGLDDMEIEKTMRSGLEAGMLQPREVPEKEERPYQAGYKQQQAGQSTNEENTSKETQTAKLLKLCEATKCFKTPDGSRYAEVPVNGHREVKGIGEKGGFRLWLIKRYYEAFGSAPSTTAVQQAIEIVTAQTEEDAPTCELFIRVGKKDGKVYLDMCNDAYQVIEIDAAGWRILDESPVYFRRSPGMLPLPAPQRGGTIEELRPFLNLDTEDDWRMIVAFELMMLHPTGPYPVLALGGEEGSTKSSTTRFIRSTIDPHLALARPAPKDKTDLNVAAQNSWVVAFENLSGIPAWLSDALCRLSTGSADGGRKLYTDGEEYIFVAKRCTIVNGIADLVTKSDLLSRTLTIGLPTMPQGKYRSEEDLNKAFADAHPRILGAILDVTTAAIQNLPHNKVSFVSRMAEMEAWMYAATPALGWEDGAFRESYIGNKDSGIDVVLEASQVALAIMAFMEGTASWRGSSTDLDKALKAKMGVDLIVKQWPSNPKTLSDAVKKLTPALRARNIDIHMGKTHGSRWIELTYREIGGDAGGDAETHRGDAESRGGTQKNMSASPRKSAPNDENGQKGDAGDAEIPHSSVREQEKVEKASHSSGNGELKEKPGNSASPASPAAGEVIYVDAQGRNASRTVVSKDGTLQSYFLPLGDEVEAGKGQRAWLTGNERAREYGRVEVEVILEDGTTSWVARGNAPRVRTA